MRLSPCYSVTASSRSTVKSSLPLLSISFPCVISFKVRFTSVLQKKNDTKKFVPSMWWHYLDSPLDFVLLLRVANPILCHATKQIWCIRVSVCDGVLSLNYHHINIILYLLLQVKHFVRFKFEHGYPFSFPCSLPSAVQ